MNAHLTLTLNFFWLLALLHGAQSQVKTKPTHLTKLTGRTTKNHSIPVSPVDQCFTDGEESRTFGLEFRFPRNGGRCDRGMLICYPSKLATHSLNYDHHIDGIAVNSELFNVDSAVNNTLSKQCESLVGNENKSIIWHGINVTTKKIYETGKLFMKVKTSLLGEEYGYSFDIYPAREFVLHFGNEREFFTYVTVDGEEPTEVEGEKAKREAYKQLAPRGARLKDFIGLWTLGLDMLPFMEKELKLYVNRSCDCTIDAWFIRPTDSDTKDVHASRGSPGVNCEETDTNKTVPVNQPGNKTFVQKDSLILIRMLTSEDIRNATFILEGKDSDKLGPLMKFFIDKEKAIISVRARKSNELTNGTTKAINLSGKNASQIDFLVAFTGYSYIIVMNGTLLFGNEIFPPKWWEGLPFDKVNNTKVFGQFLLLTIPQVMLFVTIQRNYEPPQIPNPYNETVHHLQIGSINLLNGSNLIFRVKPRNPKAYSFNVYLLHDRPTLHETIGATVLKIHVYVDQHKKQSKFELSFFTAEYKESISTTFTVPTMEHDDLLELNIKVFSDHYTFMMNEKIVTNKKLKNSYPADLPIWATNYVRVEGDDVKLLGVPYVYVPKKNVSEPNSNITVKLNTLLNYDDNITIITNILKPTRFSILLMHESLEPNKHIGDVLLGLAFNFKPSADKTSDSDDQVNTHCESFLHGDPEEIMREHTGSIHKLNYHGQDFEISIISTKDHFSVKIADIAFSLNCSYPSPFNKTSNTLSNATFPPWAVDYIRIVGDVKVHGLSISHAPPTPKLAIKKINGTLRPGDLIIVKINTTLSEKGNFNVAVNLFNEALERHEFVGKTVMSMVFDENKKLLDFRGYNMLKCSETIASEILVLESEELDFAIHVTDVGLNVRLNNKHYTCPDKEKLSKWAVDYITVKQQDNNVKLFNPPNITCVPEERCIEPKKGKTEHYDIEKDSIRL